MADNTSLILPVNDLIRVPTLTKPPAFSVLDKLTWRGFRFKDKTLAGEIIENDGWVNMQIKANVLILLAAYNGEKYIAELLDSLLIQQGVNVSILISLDKNTDSSYKIIRKYQTCYS